MKQHIKLVIFILTICLFLAGGIFGTVIYYNNIISSNSLPNIGREGGPTNSLSYFKENVEPGYIDFEIDKKTARKIGDAVFMCIYGNDDLGGGTMQDTVYRISETEDGLAYLYSRIVDEEALGGQYCVLISKRNGTIIGTWIWE